MKRHTRRVAIAAALIGCVVYVGAAALADALVIGHLQGNVDARLRIRLTEVANDVPRNGTPTSAGSLTRDSGSRGPSENGDVDDAPIFTWWIPDGSAVPIALQSADPALHGSAARVGGVADATIDGHPFRLHQLRLTRGRLVGATSVAELDGVRNTLIVLEGSLLPVIGLLIFFIATIIGRGAASPIERARREQLDFTADASHELRTPLAVIEAEVGLALSADRSAPAYRSALEHIAGESRRLRGIVNDLLWLARLDALPDPPQFELVEIGRLATAAAERFQPVAAARGVEICAHPGSPGALVKAPPDWIDRLLAVLVDNACRYCDEGGTVEIAARTVGGRGQLVVEDSGPGIDEADRSLVLRRFHRANREPGGAGLGLSIAETIVRQTGGRWAIGRSERGGARIEISWPARSASTASPEAEPSTKAVAGEAKPRGS